MSYSPGMAEPPDSTAAPRIKITGLHIAGYRSLRRVDWPEDGLDWRGEVPDTVLVGGANGSGKTTLLELLFEVVRALLALSAGVELVFDESIFEGRRVGLGFSVGRHAFTLQFHGTPPPWAHVVLGPAILWSHTARLALKVLRESFQPGTRPQLIYFPTDRAVRFPFVEFKGPGSRRRSDEIGYRYSPPTDWQHSVEAILYDARWRDLNAKERGKQSPGHFAAFERVMQRFFAGAKQLYWDDDGVLHVRTQDGVLHPLEALSSGEKQILLFAAELVDRWTPGSLVLIDEPELHLHEAWLAALWDLICELQQERGGQVIVATQSNYLFGLGGPGTHVLLGGWKP